MRKNGRLVMCAMRRVTGRGAALAGFLLLLTFVGHHGVTSARAHPLDVLGSHADHDQAAVDHDHVHSHEHGPDHGPHTDPVGHPKRAPRWTAVDQAPDLAAHALAAIAEPIPGRLASFLFQADAVPIPPGADRCVLLQTFLI
jgi:hypothetical protein